MSAAASRLELETPSNSESESDIRVDTNEEAELLDKLSSITTPSSSGPVIAIDLDDVLSQTNQNVAQC